MILEFDGVNSVSQCAASNERTAFRAWIQGLSQPKKLGLSALQAAALADAFESDPDDEPTALVDTCNVWCTTALVEDTLALLNIVATLPGTL